MKKEPEIVKYSRQQQSAGTLGEAVTHTKTCVSVVTSFILTNEQRPIF
jgi:hypothetical protein